MTLMEELFDILTRLSDECYKSIEIGEWPELQRLIEQCDEVENFEEGLRLLSNLATEATTSVEYGDWPELQELVSEARDLVDLYS